MGRNVTVFGADNTMNDLKAFAEITLKHGGEWWKLEESENYSLHMSKTKFMIKNQVHYLSPVFQIFNSKGDRVFASTDRKTAYDKYENLCKGGAK